MTFLLPVMLLLLFPCAAACLLFRLQGRLTLAVRVAVYVLVVLALARPALRIPVRGGTVVVVADRSASVPVEEKAAQAALIDTLIARAGAGGRVGVVSFAARPIVEHAPQTAPFGGFSAVHNDDASDLGGAIHAALSLLEPGESARLLVLSDGQYTGEDPLQAASRAAAAGVAIDYRLQRRRAAGDVAILRVDAPASRRPGEPMLATAWVSAPEAADVDYVLRRGAVEVARGGRRLPRGVTPLVFRDLADAGGVKAYELRLEPADAAADPCPENNVARFLVQTTGGKPLLCFPASPASRLPALLAKGGVAVETLPPASFDGSLATLAGYSGVVIENVRADAFGRGPLENIAAWIEHAGAGLAMTGGRNAFGIGGYYKSPLEDILPVTMELRREHRKFSMCIAVVLDRSGSMAMPVQGGRTKMDMANLGTMEVVNLLSDQDEIAVIAVDSAPHVVVPRTSAANARGQSRRILGIESMGGGIFVYEGLVAGLKEVTGSSAGVRHIVLFADAADAEEPGKYKELLANAAGAGITVSAIGLGTRADSDAALLEEIARLGGGACSFSDNAHEIPRLFAQDTFMVARNTLVTNPVSPRFTQALPRFSDTLPPQAPPLGGYNLCYLHPGATAVALSADENEAPLLALRNVGAGRALAFTGEADGEISGPFAAWEHAAEFYAALGRHCAGPLHDGSSGFLVQQRLVPGGIEITAYADVSRPEVKAVDGLELNVLRHRPGDSPDAERTKLAWKTADTLSAVVPLLGAETVLPTVVHPGGVVETLPPVCLPYSGEYAPEAGLDGAAVLASMAEATGGAKLADAGLVWEKMPRSRRLVEFAAWLYLAAALLFLFEVFERRTGWLYNRRRRAATPTGADEKDGSAPAPRRRRKKRPPAPAGVAPVAAQPTSEPPADTPKSPTDSPFAKAKQRANRRM